MQTSQGVPFVRTSRTSRAAAESLKTTIKIIQWRILPTYGEAPTGLTCAEIERKLPRLRQSTVSGRVSDLKDIGALVAKGVRPGATGRPVDVLYATTKGRKAVSL